MARKHLFWAVPLVLLLLAVIAGLLALPAFVAAPAHRATIEDFASRLTGRTVHISGKLSLSYLPLPDITATGITITGPDHEVITARALSLDLSPTALLRGQFAVSTLRLDSPVISFPWPVPGGINAIAPPPWLAALHARISNGQVHLGALDFTDVTADLFTGAGGRVRMAGAGQLDQRPVTLDFTIGQTASIGGTPLSAHINFDGIQAALDGTLDANSELDGNLAVQMQNNVTGTLQIQLTGTGISASSLTFTQGAARLSGRARLNFKPLRLTASLVGQGLDLGQIPPLAALPPPNLPIQAKLDLADLKISGRTITSMKGVFTAGPEGDALTDLNLGMDNAASLRGNILLARNNALSGQLSLVVPNAKSFLAGLGLPAETDWDSLILHARLQGTRTMPHLADISGLLGHDHVTGDVFVSAHHAAFRLNFDHLALLPLAHILQQIVPETLPASHFTADGELTATQATAGSVRLSNLLIDSSLDNGLIIRRATANIYGGMAGGSMVLNSQFMPVSAHVFVTIPNAMPLATALLPHAGSARAFFNQPLSLIAAAAGSPNALSLATVVKLGNLTFTATPLIDLSNQSAQGAVSVREPDAIDAFKRLGLINGCSRMRPLPGYPFQAVTQPCVAGANDPGLAFPGPGSLSLRAYFTAAPDHYSLTSFVANAGLLNGAGWLALQNNQLTGRIDAGTLVLPAVPTQAQVPDKLPVSGQIALTATRIIYAGDDQFGPLTATLKLAPDAISLSAIKAGIGNGIVSGSLDLTLPPAAMPVVTAKLVATNVDASALNLKQPFPLRLTAGQINATATLTATGYTAKTWAATLAGDATLTAEKGDLAGISLPNIVTALKAAAASKTSIWLTQGDTPFTTLAVQVRILQGNCTLTQASLTSPTGTLTAVGGIDLFDQSLALGVTAQPAVQPPLTLATRLIGSWVQPGQTTDTSAAFTWHAAPASH